MRRTVALLLFDEVEVLDFAGPFEVFSVTDELAGASAFRVLTVGVQPGQIRARNGLRIVPDLTLDSCPPAEVLIVPGGFGTRALLRQPDVVDWVRRRAEAADQVMSVCTGALVLAQAGLLDGLRVTTHHELLAQLAVLAPRATVDASQRFHDNGHVLTAAGISAGIDCSLHLVARLLGPEIARRTADYMEYRTI
ncbi:MAG: DJ-1/PfpI family protein [Opitutaceae bacterium]|nr:DJ-1/PfpI family protein [Opitutaceae bacterium]